MKFWCLLLFILVSYSATSSPRSKGFTFEQVLSFDGSVKTRYSDGSIYCAKKISESKITLSTYGLDYQLVSAVAIDLLADQKDYKSFTIVNFELGNGGELVIIGQGNKTDKPVKQKSYLVYYAPSKEIAVHEIVKANCLFVNLNFENEKFNFSGILDFRFDSFSSIQWEAAYFLEFDPKTEAISQDVGYLGTTPQFKLSGSFLISTDYFVSGSRNMFTRFTNPSAPITNQTNGIYFSDGASTTSINAPGLHNVHALDFEPFAPWAAAYSYYDGNEQSAIYLSNNESISLGSGELFGDYFIHPRTKKPILVTSTGVYIIQISFEQALKIAESNMLVNFSKWQVQNPLETEDEHLFRMREFGRDAKDSILTNAFNQMLAVTSIEIFNGSSYQQEFGALRMKLTAHDDFFYCKNLSSLNGFEHPTLNQIQLEYHDQNIIVSGFDFIFNGKVFRARKILKPVILKETILELERSELVSQLQFEFVSKADKHQVKLYVDDVEQPVEIVALKNDRFQLNAPIEFNAYRATIDVFIGCELGDTHFDTLLTCDYYLNNADQDCFLKYTEDAMVGFTNPSEFVEAMNVCVIIANSNFTSLDSTIAEIDLSESIVYANELKSELVEHYNYLDTHVTILPNMSLEDMTLFFRSLEKIDLSPYWSTQGAPKINFTLVVISHGSQNNLLITSDGKEFDITDAIMDLNGVTRFNEHVQDFLYLEDICFGSIKKEEKLERGHLINPLIAPNFCRYANKTTKVAVLASVTGKRVGACKFIQGFTETLRENYDQSALTLDQILVQMQEKNRTEEGGLPLLINLHKDMNDSKAQKSFYFYTDPFLKNKDEIYKTQR